MTKVVIIRYNTGRPAHLLRKPWKSVAAAVNRDRKTSRSSDIALCLWLAYSFIALISIFCPFFSTLILYFTNRYGKSFLRISFYFPSLISLSNKNIHFQFSASRRFCRLFSFIFSCFVRFIHCFIPEERRFYDLTQYDLKYSSFRCIYFWIIL